MNFDVIIGNPPYQGKKIGRAIRAQSVYHRFMDTGYILAPKVCMITPARFLFDSGSIPKSWNQKMLSDPHLKVKRYNMESTEVFPTTEIRGGRCYIQR